MKKIFTIIIASFLIVAVHAQRFEGNNVIERTKFGIQGGLSVPYQGVGDIYGDYDNYGNYYSGDGYYSDAKAGLTGGLQVEIPLKNGWYLQPEVNYTQMGGKDNVNFNDKNGDRYSVYTKLSYNYLQVPILVKYKPGLQGFGIFAGPQYGYLLSAKQHYFASNMPDDDMKPVTFKSEFSIVAGLEYYFPSPNDGPSFGISLRGMSGLTNILDKSKVEGGSDNPSIRNEGITLTVGVRF